MSAATLQERADVTVEKLAAGHVKAPAARLGFDVASTNAKHETAFATLVKDADEEEQDRLKELFHMGYVAFRLYPTCKTLTAEHITAASVALNKKGSERTAEETAAYGASRKAWSRLLGTLQVATTETRGGARTNNRAAAAVTAETVTPITPETIADKKAAPVPTETPAPKMATVAEGFAFLKQEAARLDAARRATPAAFDTNLNKIIDDLVKHVNAYVLVQ